MRAGKDRARAQLYHQALQKTHEKFDRCMAPVDHRALIKAVLFHHCLPLPQSPHLLRALTDLVTRAEFGCPA